MEMKPTLIQLLKLHLWSIGGNDWINVPYCKIHKYLVRDEVINTFGASPDRCGRCHKMGKEGRVRYKIFHSIREAIKILKKNH